MIFLKKKMVCLECGTHARPKEAYKGNAILEIFLWLMFIIPGFLYTIYRSTSGYPVCKNCKSSRVVPEDSIMAKQLLEKFSA